MFGNDTIKGLTFSGAVPSTSNLATPENEVGRLAFVRVNGKWAGFAYVKNESGGAFAVGHVLTQYLAYDNADVDEAAATTVKKLKGTGDFTANEFKGMASWVIIDAGGGLKHGGHAIQRNDANYLYTDETWGEALTVASDYQTHMLNGLTFADADAVATKHVCGVAIGAITSDYYGWVQVSGVCRKVRSDGNTADPVVVGEGVTAAAAAGACKGWTNAGTTAEDIYYTFGMALAPDAEADAAGEGVPVQLDCLRYWGL